VAKVAILAITVLFTMNKNRIKTLLRKDNIIFLVLLPLTIPSLIMIRVLSPFLLVRFRMLGSHRLGHFTIEPELYLCKREVQGVDKKTLDFLYHSHDICNQQLKKMWERTLNISFFSGQVDRLNRYFPGHEVHSTPWLKRHADPDGVLLQCDTHLSFTSEEEKQGQDFLTAIGLEPQIPFVCFIARDSSYLNQMESSLDWSYHDYRDSNILNYLDMAEELVNRGYTAFRMGAAVKQAIPSENQHVVDYAIKHRSDFLDVYLFAKCHFMIVSNSGPCDLGWTLRKNIAFVNVAPLLGAAHVRRGNDLMIPKKYWLTKEKRFMTFREIMESGVGSLGLAQHFVEHQVELIENTPEEITALAVEMDERLKGTWQTTEADIALQKRFEAILIEYGVDVTKNPRMGATFLREHGALLMPVI
jgi:putative glycosyltransferase (TIGR04372 family)